MGKRETEGGGGKGLTADCDLFALGDVLCCGDADLEGFRCEAGVGAEKT
jgi:hypothetical protein